MHEQLLLGQLAFVGAVGVATALVLVRLRVPPVAAFLMAGALIGPHGLRLIPNADEIRVVAEIGVVLLLFTIGLEFSLERLRFIWRPVVVGGSVQFFGTAAGAVAILVAAGESADRAVVFGAVAALSSTAIVLRALTDRGELEAPHGRFTVGVLIYQDLLVVPMMLLVPALAGEGGNVAREILVALAEAVLIVLAVGAVARVLLPRAFAVIDRMRSREMFVLAVLTVGLGTAALMEEAGLSLALGAFVAGLLLADTEYGERAMTDVIPFRDAFTGIFFISLGMLFDVSALLEEPVLVALIVTGLLLGKWLIASVAALAMRYPARAAWRAGVNLAQFGEFGFVLLTVAEAEELVTSDELSLVVAAGALSMLLSRLLIDAAPRMRAGEAVLRPLERLLRIRGMDEPARAERAIHDHVVVVGYGVAGRLVSHVLASAGVPYLVLELDAERVRAARDEGEPAYYGDVTSPETMRHARLHAARALVLLINDPDAARRAISAAFAEYPSLPILVRTRRVTDRRQLLEIGAAHVVVEELESGAEMSANVLALVGMTFTDIRHFVDDAMTAHGQPHTQEWLSVPLQDEVTRVAPPAGGRRKRRGRRGAGATRRGG